MITDFKKCLVVVAHPDDEVLGCGATIAKLTNAGCEVRILMLNPQHKVDEQIREACQTIGVGNYQTPKFGDNFDKVPKVEIHQYLRQIVRSYQPDLVMTHFDGDLHIDHRIVAEAVMVETRPTFPNSPTCVLMFPVVSSSDFNGNTFTPNMIVDVNETLQRKIDGMKCYSEEYMNLSKFRGEKHIKGSAWFWGMKAGIENGEPFKIMRLRS